MQRQWGEDELTEQWTLTHEELGLLANKAGPTRLGFAVLLKVFGRDGRFPRSRQEVAGAVVVHLGKQVGVPAEQYDWRGRAIKYHRAQIRAFFGFREATVQDGNALTAWLLEAPGPSRAAPGSIAQGRLRLVSWQSPRAADARPPGTAHPLGVADL